MMNLVTQLIVYTSLMYGGYKSIQSAFKPSKIKEGFRLTKTTDISQKQTQEGVLFLGPTGSGKSTSVAVPALLNKNLKGSIVCCDPKLELYELSAHFQQTVCNRNVILFAPLQPGISAKYNLLENCKDNTEIMQLASSLLFNGSLATELATGKKAGGIEWIDMATPLLTAALLYCKNLKSPENTITAAYKLILKKSNEEIELLFSTGDEDVKDQYDIFKSVEGSKNAMGSIKITLATNMKLFIDNNIIQINNGNDFTAKDLREREIIIYISYPENKSNYLSPYIAPFFSQLIDQLINNYSKTSLPIIFLFDEFANCGSLNNMSINAATVRSREISLIVCLQSLTQLYQLYGNYNGKAIINNLKTKLILPGLSDQDTLQYIEYIAGSSKGKTTSKTSSTNNSNGKTTNSTTRNIQEQNSKVLPVEKIRCINDNEVIVIFHNKKPTVEKQNIYYLDENYLKLINKTEIKTILLTPTKMLTSKIEKKEDIKQSERFQKIFGSERK